MKVSGVPFYPAHSSNYTKGRERPIRCITIHHTAANNATLRYLWADAARNGSSHFFVSDKIIEQYVDTNDTAWTNSNWVSNTESITIEVNGDWRNGYMNAAALENLYKLLVQLRRAYPTAILTFHKDVADKTRPTVCPADLKDKGYAKQAWDRAWKTLNPVTPVPSIKYQKIAPTRVQLKQTSNLWNFNFTRWADAKAVNPEEWKNGYPAGYIIDAVAIATNQVGGTYYMTAYSYNNGAIRATNGFNTADCKLYVPPVAPPIEPTIPPKPIDTDPTTPGNGDVAEQITALQTALDKLKGLLHVK